MLMSAAFLLSALLQFALALVVAALLGPGAFGLYALVLSAAILAQTFVLEWLRLSAARFHHSGAAPQLVFGLWRRTLLLSAGLLVSALVLALMGTERRWLYALIPLLAAINGVSDLRLALLRAEFAGAAFARFLLIRSGLGIVLTPLAAWRFGSAEAALLAYGLANLLPALVSLIVKPKPPDTAAPTAESPATEASPDIRALLAYSAPIVLTNGLYLGFFFALRAGVAWFGGLAMAGQFSLALEFVLKLFSTIGTALDLALFPLALKAERQRDMAAAQAQARANLEVVIAVLAPMAMGLMLVAPGLEPLLVAPAFRGAFAGFVIALCPGIALYALVQYALHPFAQLGHKTAVLAWAGAAALVAGALAAWALKGFGPSPASLAWLLVGAMAVAALLLWVNAGRAALPGVRFAVSLTACLALLGVVVSPFALVGFTLPLLVGAVLLGALAYAGGALALDLADIRTVLKARQNDLKPDDRKPAQ